jgi:hypothetical protein
MTDPPINKTACLRPSVSVAFRPFGAKHRIPSYGFVRLIQNVNDESLLGKQVKNNKNKVIFRVRGFLGNQMFSYAMCRYWQERGINAFIDVDDVDTGENINENLRSS